MPPGDGDVRSTSPLSATTNSSTISAASRFYDSACNGNVRSRSVSAANACTFISSLGRQRPIPILVLNGQISRVALFQTGMCRTAFQGILPFQLDGHVTIAGGGDGGLAVVAYIDVDVLNRHLRGDRGRRAVLILDHVRFDGNGIGCGCVFAVRLINHRVGGLHFPVVNLNAVVLLGDVLPMFLGRHGNAASGQVI